MNNHLPPASVFAELRDGLTGTEPMSRPAQNEMYVSAHASTLIKPGHIRATYYLDQ